MEENNFLKLFTATNDNLALKASQTDLDQTNSDVTDLTASLQSINLIIIQFEWRKQFSKIIYSNKRQFSFKSFTNGPRSN